MFGTSSAEESQPLFRRVQAPNRWRLGCFLLLLSQFFERMGFYGLAVNFIFFLNGDPLAWATYNAAALVLAFNTVSCLFAVVGAWAADAVAGKFRVMLAGYLLYLLFYLPLPFLYLASWDGSPTRLAPAFCLVQRPQDNATHWPPGSRGFPAWLKGNTRGFWHERCSVVVAVAASLVAVGVALIKAVVTPFGADQVQSASPDAMRSFFNWYYWIVNAGTFFAHLVLAYVQVNISMFWGYAAGYVVIAISGLLLLLARPFLRRLEPQGSGAGDVVRVLGAACCGGRNDGDLRRDASVQQREEGPGPRCLDRCKNSRGGRFEPGTVEEVKKLLRILLVFVCFVFYWACYFQMQTSFLAQGLHMRVPFFTSSTSVPVPWLSLFDVVVIVLLIPFLDGVVYPFLSRHGLCPSSYTRMLLGMALTTGAMLVAGFVERVRMRVFWGTENPPATRPVHSVNQTIGDTVYFAADMSIFYQVPQYALLGLGEAFTSVAGLEFAYTEAPPRLESLVTGCYWLFAGVGALLGVLVVQSLQGRLLFSDDTFDINYRAPCINDPARLCAETRLDAYFFILAGLQTLGMALLVGVVVCVLPRCRAPAPAREDVLEESGDSLLASMDSVSSQRLVCR